MTSRPFPETGYRPPTKADSRNFPLEKAQAVAPFPPSYKTDISGVPVYDQMEVPDCVENTLTFIKRYHILKNYKLSLDLSRRFLTIWTVIRDGFSLDKGTSIENAMYEAHKRGICESSFLSDNHQLDVPTFSSRSVLTDAAIANGLTHTIASYAFVTDLSANGLKNAIYQNGVVAVGAIINQNWWTDIHGTVTWDKAAILPIRPPKTKDPAVDPSVSGHCFVLYGYDETQFFFVNSFGTSWAEAGCGYFGADFLPYVYEAAVLVDLSPEAVQTLKSDLSATQDAITKIDPTTPEGQQELGLVGKVIQLLTSLLSQIFDSGRN